MTRKHAIHDAEAHVVTSHGADFFGEDRHALKSLTSSAASAPAWASSARARHSERCTTRCWP